MAFEISYSHFTGERVCTSVGRRKFGSRSNSPFALARPHTVNPRTITYALSGYGASGPAREQPAYDYTIQGMAGWASLTGEPDGPLRRGRRVALRPLPRALPGVAEVGDDPCYPRSTGGPDGIGQQRQRPGEPAADRLGIAHPTVSHPPLFTVEQSRELRGTIPGAHTKNLFLKDKKGALFLVTALEDAAAKGRAKHRDHPQIETFARSVLSACLKASNIDRLPES